MPDQATLAPKPAEWVIPDGHFVTIPSVKAAQVHREITDRLRSEISNLDTADLPELIIAFGKCRVGSTALSNAIGRAGVASFFQPFKSMLRQHLCNENNLSYFQQFLEPDIVYCKEMFGPYTEIESVWNPFLTLLEIGYPIDKLRLVWLERDPFDALTSWVRNWSQVVPVDTLIDHFELASKSAALCAQSFEDQGVEVLRFNYDTLSEDGDAIFNLLSRMNLHLNDKNEIVNWGKAGDLASPHSAIRFTAEPAAYGQVKVHSNREDYRFVPQTYGILDGDMRLSLMKRGLYQIYEEHKCLCAGRSDCGAFASMRSAKA